VAKKKIIFLNTKRIIKKKKKKKSTFKIVTLYFRTLILRICFPLWKFNISTFDLLFAESSSDNEVEVVAFMQVFKTHCAL